MTLGRLRLSLSSPLVRKDWMPLARVVVMKVIGVAAVSSFELLLADLSCCWRRSSCWHPLLTPGRWAGPLCPVVMFSSLALLVVSSGNSPLRTYHYF